MRARHAIATAIAVIVIGFGGKLIFFSAPTAEAQLLSTKSASMDIYRLQRNGKDLPAQKIHDMTFIFADGE